jgi:CheY-like chemotaxis protein
MVSAGRLLRGRSAAGHWWRRGLMLAGVTNRGRLVATVLVADDDAVIRALVKAVLERDWHVVIEAARGDEAWAMIQRRRPELAVLDINMPGMTGLEIVAAMRADPSLASTRVIILTASPEPAEVQQALRAGGAAYMQKPFSPRVLADAVTNALAAKPC